MCGRSTLIRSRDMSEVIEIPGYKILQPLGRGGMASVYLAVQESFGRKVALKIMSPTLNSDPSFSTRFMREARIVAQIHHASIVPVFDVGQHQSLHYLSMEHLPGGDLKRRIISGGGDALAVNVCTAISSALDLSHRKGFIHRDIKPENILFREDGTPVLTDFGIARATHGNATQTVTGMFIGTPAYMSPEQVKGLELDARTDLYSLGIVFYEMLTGTVPFHSDSLVSLAVKHLNEPVPPLPERFSAYQHFLDRLTAKDREQRFESGAAVIDALRDLNASAPMSVTVRRPGLQPATATTPAPLLAPQALAKTSTVKTKRRWGLGIGATVVTTVVIAIELLVGGPRNGSADVNEVKSTVAKDIAPQRVVTPASIVDSKAEIAAPELPAPVMVAPEPAPVASAESPHVVQKTHRAELDPATKRKRIEDLLAAADEEYIRGSLDEPAGANALEHYRAVLKLQPDNADALRGIQNIEQVLAARSERVYNATNGLSGQPGAPGSANVGGYSSYDSQARRLRDLQRVRREERDPPPPEYDGRIDIPTPNVPVPEFHPR
jgi:serine/threonine-protein kinase PpkA